MRLTLLILLCRLRERQGRFPAGVNRVVDASSVLTYNGIELECGVVTMQSSCPNVHQTQVGSVR